MNFLIILFSLGLYWFTGNLYIGIGAYLFLIMFSMLVRKDTTSEILDHIINEADK